MNIVFHKHAEHAALRETVQLFSQSYRKESFGYSCLLLGEKRGTSDIHLTVSRALSQEEWQGKKRGPKLRVYTEYPKGHLLAEREVESVDARREMKRQLYIALAEATKIAWPWGALTGIRPTQVALRVLEERQGDKEKAADFLEDFFLLSKNKADKVLACAIEEKKLLDRLPEDKALVYVGIPFCPSRCHYCSFITRDALRHQDQLSDYVKALCLEIKETFAHLKEDIPCLYIGGGTPTSLSEKDFALLLETIGTYLPLAEDCEITVEAGRPDTISTNKLLAMKALGVNRLCINPQSMQDRTLEAVGRKHSVADVLRVFAEARERGFDNINMDLILGLPGEGPDDVFTSCKSLLELGVEGITIHSLALKRSSFLQEKSQSGDLQKTLPQPIWLEALDRIDSTLLAHDYQPYYLYRQKYVFSGLENTGFARPGKECLYNVGMMFDARKVIGLGSGSSSKRLVAGRAEKLYNSKDIGHYTKNIQELVEKKVAFFQE